MREFLRKILACPHCSGEFEANIFTGDKEEAVDGILFCKGCGSIYPIIDTIPRILEDAFRKNPAFLARYDKELRASGVNIPAPDDSAQRRLDKLTQESFGFQWSSFSEMSCDFRENFLNYIYPQEPSFFKGKTGLDVGCGFGRHIYNAAQFGAQMVGMDFSSAIDSTHKNTRHMQNVHLVQADIYRPPFKNGVFDFIYSIGVLHHLSDPEAGFKSLIPVVKPKGVALVWVYSSKRKFTVFFLEILRGISTRIPHFILKKICFLLAGFEWLFLILPYRSLKKISVFDKALSKILFPRIKLYAQYPFQVSYADWFDRLAAPVRFYYNEDELRGWFERADLINIRISPTGLYGLRGCGEKPNA